MKTLPCLCDFKIATQESWVISTFSEELIKLLKHTKISLDTQKLSGRTNLDEEILFFLGGKILNFISVKKNVRKVY